MNGSLGILSQNGKQIGGFLNWNVEHGLVNDKMERSWKGYKVQTWKARGKQPWFFEKPDGDEFDASFYITVNNKLAEVFRDRVKAKLPSSFPLNVYIQFVLEMRQCDKKT